MGIREWFKSMEIKEIWIKMDETRLVFGIILVKFAISLKILWEFDVRFAIQIKQDSFDREYPLLHMQNL